MNQEQEKLIEEMNQAFISISEITNREPDDYDDVLHNIDLIREICENILNHTKEWTNSKKLSISTK